MTTPSSVPAQGEAESPWIDPIRDPLNKLLELADDSDGACYGTLSTSIARDLITEALAAIDRAIVAASPCAAQPAPITVATLARASDRKLSPILRAINVFGGDVTVNQPLDLALIGAALSHAGCGLAAAAQGGQQPDEGLQERYNFVLAACRDAQDAAASRGWALHDIAQNTTSGRAALRKIASDALLGYTAPAAPAAPLTEAQIDAIAHNQDDGEWLVRQITKMEWRRFSRDIESACAAKWGITLAGTAGTKKEGEDGR